jgi:hypothetical protein
MEKTQSRKCALSFLETEDQVEIEELGENEGGANNGQQLNAAAGGRPIGVNDLPVIFLETRALSDKKTSNWTIICLVWKVLWTVGWII